MRPPQVTLTQTPMVALRQPHSRIMLTTPQQIQLNPLQPGEKAVLSRRPVVELRERPVVELGERELGRGGLDFCRV